MMMRKADLVSAIPPAETTCSRTMPTRRWVRPDYPAKERRQGGTFRRGQEVGRCRKDNHTGISTNGYFFDHPEYIIHTDAKRDTDPYGKPAMVYTHSGGVEGIATDLYRILSADLSARLDLERYKRCQGGKAGTPAGNCRAACTGGGEKGNDIRQVAGQEAEVKRENDIKTAAGQGTEVKKGNA